MGRAAGIALSLLVSLAACTRTVVDSGGRCELNSDCKAPLVCAASLCRPQCRGDRDCSTGESCVLYGDTGVCVPPAMPVPCVYASQCGSGLACIGGTCRAMCVADRDCAGGTCTAGTCTTPVTTGGSDAGSSMDGGNDAGTVADGAACTTTCGARCVDLQSDPEHCGRCDNACARGDECRLGACVACPAGTSCPAVNDECDGALFVTLSGATTDLHLSTHGWSDSPLSCGTDPDGFVRFHLDVRSLVAINAGSTSTVAALSWVDTCSGPAHCGHPCALMGSSYLFEVLDVGDHVFAVDTMDPDTVLVDIVVLPLGPDVPATPLGLDGTGSGNAMATLVAGAPLPAGCSTGPAHVFYFSGCQFTAAVNFHATACTTGERVRVGYYSSDVDGISCNTGGSTCPPGSARDDGLVDTTLHAFVLSGETPTDVGDVAFSVTGT